MKAIMLFCFVFLVVKISALPTNPPTNQGTLGFYNDANIQELFVNATNEAILLGIINATNDLGSERSDPDLHAPTNYDCRVRSVPPEVRRRLRLSTFYTQYAHAYGIPVLSSSRVKRGALTRACYVMRFLFADRKDIRDWFYRRNGRAGIMARSEGTTSIPEHSFLPAWWNQRARGLGATIQVPISTGGEENLLCEQGDRYYNEDIFLHEFVHGIHNLGATGAIPGFDARLRAAYNSARSRGLWRNTYAMSTDREYFAEGTQSFFHVNAYSARPNGIHNHVNTREKLRTYDPTLYNLVKEVFPCQNNFLKRCHAKNGQTAPPFKMDCKNGGGTVVTDKPPKPNTPPIPTPKPDTPPVPTPPKPDTPPVPTPPKPDTPPVPTPPKPDTPPVPTPPKPDTPPVPTPPKPDTPPVPTPPKPDTPPVSTPPKPDTPPVPTPSKPDTPPVPTPPKPDTPPVPTPPKPDTPPVPTPPKPDTPPVPTPPKPDTPPVPTPPKPDTPPVPTPPKPDTPPVPTPPKPDTPPVPTPPKPDTPPVPTPPKPDTPPVPTPPKPDTPPVPTPPKPDTPPVPTPPKPDTPPVPTRPKPTTKKTPPPNCYNRHYNCDSWARNGECQRNPGYMKRSCCKSCYYTKPRPTRPKPNCYNRHYNCDSWARNGECQRNPRYMKTSCCKSCSSSRTTCTDNDNRCSYYARYGYCPWPPYKRLCPRSCRLC